MMGRSLEGRGSPAGYRMIEELRVKNFRCFESLKLEKLRRINIIVGRNAVGKTALLEAIKLAAAGTPQSATWINAVRGVNPPIMGPMSRDQFESLWDNLFFGLEKDRHIVLDRTDSNHLETSLEIFYDPSQPVTQIPQQQPPSSNGGLAAELEATRRLAPTAIVPLVFRRKSLANQGDLKATVLPNGQLHLETGPELGPSIAVLGASVGYQPADSTSWFSSLVQQNRESEAIELVEREYPEVKGLALVQNTPFTATLWVNVSYLKNKIPLSLLSAGVNKFVTLILAAHFYKSGVLLVDEIENHTYYARLPSLWTALHRIAVDNDTQIFATTHSQECLDAALEMIRADEEQFSLIRLRRENGKTTKRHLFGAAVASAIEEGIEIRGPSDDPGASNEEEEDS